MIRYEELISGIVEIFRVMDVEEEKRDRRTAKWVKTKKRNGEGKRQRKSGEGRGNGEEEKRTGRWKLEEDKKERQKMQDADWWDRATAFLEEHSGQGLKTVMKSISVVEIVMKNSDILNNCYKGSLFCSVLHLRSLF